MMFVKNFYCLAILTLSLYLVTIESIDIADKDPFKALGIPDLNPKALLEEVDMESNKTKKNQKTFPKLKTIEDVPGFLKNGNMNEEEGVKILTRFLIQDDFQLKKYGVVYDQTGFDGLTPGELVAPIGTEERVQQIARSAASIWFKEKHKIEDYDAYGANLQMDEIVPNWRIYKVLMIGKNGENTYVKVCVPLDESETALCSENNNSCGYRAEYVEKEKKKNEDYISKIKSNNFFKKAPVNVRLLPGEKIIAKENNKEIVLDSSTFNSNEGNLMGVYNPPQLNQANNSNMALDAFKNKNNGFMPNNQMGGMNMNQQNMGMQGSLPNVNGINPNFNLSGNMGNNMMNSIPNMGFMNSNTLSNNLSFGQQQMKPNPNLNMNIGQNPNQFVFKQKDQVGQVPSQQPAKMDNSSQLMNEMMQLKNQMAQMMQTMKQKDEIINQQNIKLTQMNSNFGGANSPSAPGMNNMNGMNGMNNMNNVNNMNNINNMNGMNNLRGINNMNGMNSMNNMDNNMGFQNNQNGNIASPNNNGAYPFNNFQFKANENSGQPFQYPPSNNSNNGRKISPFLSMNLNKHY